MGGALARIPSPSTRRGPLDRAAVGVAAAGRTGRRGRPRTRVRDRSPSDDEGMYRAPFAPRWRQRPRRRDGLGCDRRRCRNSRLRARLRVGRRPGCGRGGEPHRPAKRRAYRRQHAPTCSSTRCPTQTSWSPTSSSASSRRCSRAALLPGRSRPATSPTSDRARWLDVGRPSGAGRLGRRSARLRERTLLSLEAGGHVLRAFPGLQGLVRRRAGDPRAPACRRAQRGRRGRGRRGRQHVLCDPRSRLEVAPGGLTRVPVARARVRDGLRRQPRRRIRRKRQQTSRSCPRGAKTSPDAVARDVGAIGCVQTSARLERTRAFVKIQDGCSFSCAFCVIPLVRGATRSRRADAVLAEIRKRVSQGHPEIVLTGVNLGCFRDREAGYTLARLVREAGAIPGVRAPPAVVHRGEPPERRADRGAARDRVVSRPISTFRCSPATTPCCAR